MDTPPAPTHARSLDRRLIRSRFPALRSETVFLENAGGSQVPAVVADRMRRYMLETYVQLGAGYEIADACDRVVEEAHDLVGVLMNGAATGRVILGPSTSQLCAMLAEAYAAVLEPGDEIIVTEAGHEANIGPWTRLAARGVTVRTWAVDAATQTCPLETLAALLTDRTRLVAVVHVSNLLGEIVDIAAVTDLVHGAGGPAAGGRPARVVVDGVAYAPHRAIDVAAWDVDWYVFSAYKTYGPHMAALYGRHDALAEVTGPNHFFIPDDEAPYKFELGGVNHEGCAGLLGLGEYLATLAAGADVGAPRPDRAAIVDAFAVMKAAEEPVQRRLVEYLAGRPEVRIIGPAHGEDSRVGTVSFRHASRSSREIATAAHARQIGIRHGHMYAYRLCRALGIEPEDGVVRVSLVHYNTVEEIDRLIEVLDEVL